MTDVSHQWIRKLPGRRHASDGQVAVIFALLLLGLIGFVALSIDGGYVMAERRQVQNAADAGALAAAKALYDSKTGDIQSAGSSYATHNAGSGSSAVVAWPPTTGAHAGDDQYVQVTVTKNVRKFFIGAVYGGSWTVSATATAGIETDPADYALITLDKDTEPGIYMNGNTGIVLTGGKASAMSNTNIRGSNNTSFRAPGTIDANGSIQSGSNWTTVRPGQPQIDDPLEWMSPPPKLGAPKTFPADCGSNSGCTLTEGWYRNTSVTVRRTMTLQPGVYYFENVSLSMQNTNSRIEGSNVLLYFDSGSTFDPKNGEVDLTYRNANVAGVQRGLVFWYARCNTLDLQGNGEMYFEGIFYAPCADVQMHGNPGTETVRGQMFVGTLDVRGTSDLGVSYHKHTDTVKPKIYLVE